MLVKFEKINFQLIKLCNFFFVRISKNNMKSTFLKTILEFKKVFLNLIIFFFYWTNL